MRNGKLLTWDGWQQPQPSVVWDPADPQAFATMSAPTSVFCDGAAVLPDGRVLVAGGFGGLTTGQLGLVDTNIFDPTTSSWSRVANMRYPRWYPDVTELADGRYVAISGNSTDGTHWADTPEVYDPAANSWTELAAVSTAQVHEEEYPFSYLAPNGKVFTMAPSKDASFFLDATNQTWTAVGGSSGIRNGSSVMYRPGQVLYSGGSPDIRGAASQNTSAVIDLTAATPTWRTTAPMTAARTYHTLTMLADGKVLAAGGEPTSNQAVITSGVLPTEIWDPATLTWTEAAPMAVARNYHSTAVLMPDATVLVAGGGHSEGLGDAGQYSAQTYSPAYLFNGPRPTISAAPAAASYASTMAVSTPDAAAISSVNLVSMGADTHQSDMAQHFVPLSFTTAGANGLNVATPTSSAVAPPGYYMVFIVNSAGVPSVASIVRLGQSGPTVPAAPTGVSAAPGDGTATVSWTAPGNGGSPLTSYTVTTRAGATVVGTKVVSPPATTTTVGGLTNGTTYTFSVAAGNAVGTGPASADSNPVTPRAATAPGTPSGVSATAGNRSATVAWTAPTDGGSPITSYRVTPLGPGAPPATVLSGSPPVTSTTISGLTNGSTYTFAVQATNAIGSGPQATSNAVVPVATQPPAYVQEADAHTRIKTTLAVTPTAPVTAGNRLIVEVGVWSSGGAKAGAVTDSAGNAYVELTRFTAADRTEMTVWTAPVTAGGGSRPTISVTTTAPADIGLAALEYSGLSTIGDASAVDQQAHATGTTGGSQTVSSGSTPATTLANELAVGLYVDSGFGRPLTGGAGYATRSNISPATDMQLLAEDALIGQGASPAATVGTGAATTWLMATVVFKPAAAAAPTAPAAPTNVQASAGDGTATVTWTAPSNGGSPILGYTVTPHAGTVAMPGTLVTYLCRVSSPMMTRMAAAVPSTSAVITGLTNGQTYTFTVTATNDVGTGPPSSESNAVTPRAATAPGVPGNVTATAGNASATVAWTAPADGGSPLTGYTVTPFVGAVAQPATTLSGSPPATTVTVTGLTNGTAYTFVVSASNGVGTGPSATSPPVTPVAAPVVAFVQQVNAHGVGKASIAVTPTTALTAGNRLVVAVDVWYGAHPIAGSVTDSAGNVYTELSHSTASDGTELSVWTAPITRGAQTKPTITVTPTGRADIGVAALEYSGLSGVPDASVVDGLAQAAGRTTAAAVVSSGSTAPATAGPELAVGFYADSGFSSPLTPGARYTARANLSPFNDIDLLVEDRSVAAGATSAATAGTGASTVWLMTTIVLKAG